MGSRNRQLRTGYTTGACAAAAAKAATFAVLGGQVSGGDVIEIPFPDGTRHGLPIAWLSYGGFPDGAFAAVIKDGGDDPDVTNGAEIQAKVVFHDKGVDGSSFDKGWDALNSGELPPIVINGGKGVGKVTKPGLAVPVGEAAINPVPRSMIREAIKEAFLERHNTSKSRPGHIEVTIWVPEGEAIAKKTLNGRLGIVGGISILGTTGIVRPLSAEAWTATISASMSVAKAAGLTEVVLSSGRSSEKAHMAHFGLPEASYVMMGDYVEFAVLEAKKYGFTQVHLVAQWAKMLKTAMATPQTHVRHGAIDLGKAVSFLRSIGCPDLRTKKCPDLLQSEFNTAREIFDALLSLPNPESQALLRRVCATARAYAESLTAGIPVRVHLISFTGEVIAQDG